MSPQEPKTVSWQNKILRLAEDNKQLKKDKMYPKAILLTLLLCLRLCIKCHLSPLIFSPCSPPLNLSEHVSLKIKPLKFENLKTCFLIFPGLKLNCESQSKISGVTEALRRYAEEFILIIQIYQPGFSDLY